MQIIEHQNLHLVNLISYTRNIKHSEILKLVRYISDNLQVLDLKQSDKILFTEKPPAIAEDVVKTEILIPVDGKIIECKEFQCKPLFQLINAITIRHEGTLEHLYETEKLLKDFIIQHNYRQMTPTYYVISRNNDTNCIIDIYIGINYESIPNYV